MKKYTEEIIVAISIIYTLALGFYMGYEIVKNKYEYPRIIENVTLLSENKNVIVYQGGITTIEVKKAIITDNKRKEEK